MPIAVYPEYGNTIAWVQLPWALAPNTQYTYNVTGVTDMSGNAMTPATSTFTTGRALTSPSRPWLSTSSGERRYNDGCSDIGLDDLQRGDGSGAHQHLQHSLAAALTTRRPPFPATRQLSSSATPSITRR